MKNYTMVIDKKTYPLIAKNNKEAIKLVGVFAKNSYYGVSRLVREDGRVII